MTLFAVCSGNVLAVREAPTPLRACSDAVAAQYREYMDSPDENFPCPILAGDFFVAAHGDPAAKRYRIASAAVAGELERVHGIGFHQCRPASPLDILALLV